MANRRKIADERSQSERDCDSILYSAAYRRLAGVTQVVSVDEVQLFHNRLTHTMKVAQLTLRLADDLVRGGHVSEEDIDVHSAEAAALAHDLGHPPFGHIGEDVLRELCTDSGAGGFEGNAQSFRIVTTLAGSASNRQGLGLSPRTLNGILKYPWFRNSDPPQDGATPDEKYRWRKWGAYRTESDDFEEARAGDTTDQQSLEARVMDWCDDISYALHDVEDFYRVGLLPLERLRDERSWFSSVASSELGRQPKFDPDRFDTALGTLLGLLPAQPYKGGAEDDQSLHGFTNDSIGKYFAAVEVVSDGKRLAIETSALHEVMVLKQLTWQYVVNSPSLASIQDGQQRIVRVLYERLEDWLRREVKSQPHRLPRRLKRYYDISEREATLSGGDISEEAVRSRAVADYICTLTEDQAVDLYKRLDGLPGSSVLEGWVRR